MKAKKFINCLLVAMLAVTMIAVGTVSPVDAAAKKPAKAKITKASSPSNGTLTVKWKKVKQAKGYQVRIGTNQKTTSGKQVKNLKSTKHTFKKLKPGKKYYVKVRAYKLSGKKKVYGSWSKVKSIEVKKTESSSSSTNPTKPSTGGGTTPTNPTKPSTGGGTTPTNPTQPTSGSTTPTNPTQPTTGGGGGTVIGSSTGKLCDEIGHVGFISDVQSTKFVTWNTTSYYVFFYKGVNDHAGNINNLSTYAYTSPFADAQNHVDNAANSLMSKVRASSVGILDTKYWGVVSDTSQFFMDLTELSGAIKSREVKIPVQGGTQYTTYKCLFCGHEDTYDTTKCVHKWQTSDNNGTTNMGKALVAAGHTGTGTYQSQKFCKKCGVYQ